MADHNELLDAVDALTLPRTTKVVQENRHGISCVSEVEHEPRLKHLRSAVVGGIGSHSGGSSEPRLPFDADALRLYTEIESETGRWFVEATGQPVHLLPETTIRHWYLNFEKAHRAGNASDDDRRRHTRRLEGWVRAIDGKFDPPKRIELTVTIREPLLVPVVRYRADENGYRVPVTILNEDGTPKMRRKLHWKTKKPLTRVVEQRPATCPECGENTAFDPKTGDRILALILEFRDLDADGPSDTPLGSFASLSNRTLNESTVTCRSCGFVWSGSFGVRAVQFELEQEEQRLNAEHAGTVGV